MYKPCSRNASRLLSTRDIFLAFVWKYILSILLQNDVIYKKKKDYITKEGSWWRSKHVSEKLSVPIITSKIMSEARRGDISLSFPLWD